MAREMQKQALISVTDKSGIVPFARSLNKELNFGIVASDGTTALLRKHNIPVRSTTSISKFPPTMRPQGVKTLHPMILGGVFADKSNKSHMADAKKFNMPIFDLVVCNFYAFEEALEKKNFRHEDAIMNIDIGGPTMVRAAAKNYKNVAVVVDLGDYEMILNQYRTHGEIDLEIRRELAVKAFAYAKRRDDNIIEYLKQLKKY